MHVGTSFWQRRQRITSTGPPVRRQTVFTNQVSLIYNCQTKQTFNCTSSPLGLFSTRVGKFLHMGRMAHELCRSGPQQLVSFNIKSSPCPPAKCSERWEIYSFHAKRDLVAHWQSMLIGSPTLTRQRVDADWLLYTCSIQSYTSPV